MEDNKYYTPDIEDLYIGYRCETYNAMNGEWVTDTLNGYNIQELYMTIESVLSVYIKTKYLDKEDIESLGWVWSEQHGWYTFGENQEWLMVIGTTVPLWVNVWNDQGGWYQGECKSINELRKLIKWLNI